MFNDKYKYVLFDLDGTLLGMDTNHFVKKYIESMNKYLTDLGFNAKKIIEAIMNGIYLMINNDGSKTNEELMIDAFKNIFKDNFEALTDIIDKYYDDEFDKLKEYTNINEEVPSIIQKLKTSGYKIIIATNPLYPKIATKKRIEWAGLSPDDFEFYTTYENEYYSKPNLKYYESILSRIGATAEECIMIGNDVDEDMIASNLGIDVYLITNDILNKNNQDISKYNNGTWSDFYNLYFN